MRKIKLLISCFFILAFLFYYQPFLLWLVKPLSVYDHLTKSDAILILGDGLKSDGTLDPSTIEALDYGLKLFQEGYANRVILSGGKMQNNKAVALVMYDYAQTKGFSPESFLLEQSSQSTNDKVNFTGKILARENYKSIILVTLPYQSTRVKKMFTDTGIQVISAPVKDKQFYTARGQDRIKVFQMIGKEYINKFYYDLF